MLSTGSPPSSARRWKTWPSSSTVTAPPGRLLGLYEGVPLTSRGSHYSATSPDRITIFMATILGLCSTPEEVVEMVRRVVIHEVGHHFGINDKRLEELGW